MDDEQEKSYRSRNIALAVIACAFIVVAVFRLVQTAQPEVASQPAASNLASARTIEGARLRVHVALSPDVSLPQSTTVFLIVRATDGNPIPLAVKRFTVADLPIDVSLSDADAMVPGRSIGAAKRVEVVARASLRGDVKAAAGDYEGNSGVLNVADISAQNSTPIALLINHPL